MDKSQLLHALRAFIAQRPGIEPGNYGSWADYRQESREVTEDRHHAEIMLRHCELSGITAEQILAQARYRMTIENGRIDYCTGQYFPTEYRKAVCRLLASALWDYWREPDSTGDSLRARAGRAFPRAITSRYFR
jgi:hypothetical protein